MRPSPGADEDFGNGESISMVGCGIGAIRLEAWVALQIPTAEEVGDFYGADQLTKETVMTGTCHDGFLLNC